MKIKYIIISITIINFLIGCSLSIKESKTPNEQTIIAESAAASSKQQETETEVETTSTAAIIETETEIKTQVNTIQETTTEIKIEVTTIAETTKTTDAIVEEIISLTNNIRVAAGVDKVTYDPILTEMAQVRAEENAANNWFKVENGKHIRPDGRTASSIALEFNQYGYFGENMGRYQSTPAEIVEGWKNSPPHYSCMTSSKYNRIGIGYAKDANGYYYWNMILMD